MAIYERRERTTTTVEYALPSPVHYSELNKAMNAARVDMGDDFEASGSLWIKADADGVIVYYERSAVQPADGRAEA